MHQYKNNPENGSTLVVTVLVLVILSILGTAALTMTNTELLIARNMKLNSKAFYNAEAGVNFALSNIKQGLINSTLELDGIQIDKEDLDNGINLNSTLGISSFDANEIYFSYIGILSKVSSDRYCFITQGKDNEQSNGEVQIESCFDVEKIPYNVFKKGIVSGGNIYMHGEVNVSGSLHANGYISQSGAGNSIINGDVTSVSESTVSADVNGTVGWGEDYRIHIPTVTQDNTPNEEDANVVLEDGGQIDSDLIDGVWEESNIDSPIIYVKGDLTVVNDADVSGLTIISEGTINFRGHSSWNESDEIKTTIIAMQDIEFNGSGDSYGVFWCNGSFIRNGSSLVHGSIVAGAAVDDTDVDFSGKMEFKYIDKISDDIPVPSPLEPVQITWKEV
jgi:hypothetical protein